jgi:hypothetical protein
MLCIELNRNGQRLATAGLQGKGVLSVIFDRALSDAHGPIEHRHFRLGGLDTSTEPNSTLHWIGGPVDIGDTFTLRFLESDSADPPTHSEPSTDPTPAELRRFRQQQLRSLESELKVRALLGVEPRRKKPRPAPRRKLSRRKKTQP